MGTPRAPGWDNAPFAGSGWVTNRDAQYAANLLRLSYGAIAYSPSTARYGWSYRASDRATAEKVALEKCGTNDASILVWGNSTYLALAVADGGAYGWAWDAKPRAARKRALSECTGPNPRIAVLFDTRRG